jgi:hypothetical protein
VKAATFWKTIVADESDFLDRIVSALRESRVRFCVIGGQAVNAYVDPVVSLDLDIVIALDDVEMAERLFETSFKVETFAHSVNVSDAGSDLRVQIQTDARYEAFLARAQEQDVLGLTLPVADITDVLQDKVWAASDPSRRGSKRLKDFADIARILELRPDLIDQVPAELRERLL